MTSALVEALTGRALPPVALVATDGTQVVLSQVPGKTVVYAYPRTSAPGSDPIPGWDMIPGAKGCTPQSCGFRDHHGELVAAGVEAVFGLSAQDSSDQREAVERLHLPFPVLSDASRDLQRALDLPVFSAGGMTLLERFAMVIEDGIVTKVFHPVTEPGRNADDVLEWLRG